MPVVDKKFRLIYDQVILQPRHLENFRKVAELVRDLDGDPDLARLHSLQRKLLSEVTHAEAEQREAQVRKDAIDESHRNAVAEGKSRGCIDREKLSRLKEESESFRIEIETLKRIRWQLRVVGDGLLWKAVGFNHAYVFAISDAPGAGNTFLSDPEGLDAELEMVDDFWKKEGTLAVMHDLTNCGKIGDLTLVPEDDTIKIAEVKSSSSMDSKQVRRMEEAVSLIRGGSKTLEGGKVVRISGELELPGSLVSEVLNNIDTYSRVIDEAGTEGLGWAVISDYMGLRAINPVHPRWDAIRTAQMTEEERQTLYRKEWQPADETLEDALGNPSEDNFWYIWDSSEKREENIFGIPFSLYPLSAEQRAALICDYGRLIVTLNVNRFCKHLEKGGFALVSIPEPANKNKTRFFPSVVLTKHAQTELGVHSVAIHLNKTFMQQVIGEGMTLETVVEAVNAEAKVMATTGIKFASLLFVDVAGRRCVLFPARR